MEALDNLAKELGYPGADKLFRASERDCPRTYQQELHYDPVVPRGMQRRRRVTIRSENLGRPHGPHQEGHSIVQEHALHHR